MNKAASKPLLAAVLTGTAAVSLLGFGVGGPSAAGEPPDRPALEAADKTPAAPRLVRFTQTQTTDQEQDGRGVVRGTGESVVYADLRAARYRSERKVPGGVFLDVQDHTKGRGMTADPHKREAVLIPLPGGKAGAAAEGAAAKPLLAGLREFRTEKGVAEARVTLDGREAVRYRREEKGKTVTLWVDPRSDLPLRWEQEEVDPAPTVKLNRYVWAAFEWDPKGADPDRLFSTDPPEGYDVADRTRRK